MRSAPSKTLPIIFAMLSVSCWQLKSVEDERDAEVQRSVVLEETARNSQKDRYETKAVTLFSLRSLFSRRKAKTRQTLYSFGQNRAKIKKIKYIPSD